MLKRIIKIMVPCQGNGSPPSLDRGGILEMSEDAVIFEFQTARAACGSNFVGDAPTTQGGAFLGSPNVTVYYRPGTKGWSNKYDTCKTVMWNPAITQPGMSNHAFGCNIAGTANIEVAL